MALRRYNTEYTPPATLGLIIASVAVAMLDIANGGLFERLLWARGIDIQYGQYWRLLGAAFVHADMMHIAFNMYGLWVLGVIFERLQGWRATLIVYFVSLFGASGLTMVFYDPMTPVVGASGAVYGMFGAVLAFFFVKAGGRVSGLWEIPHARMLLVWLALGVYQSFRPGVSLLGHLGGFVPGIVLGLYFEQRYARKLDLWHTLAVGMTGAAVVFLCVFACVPVTRSSWYSVRALRAYESGELERGDELLAQAGRRSRTKEGAQLLYVHLTVWRRYHQAQPKQYPVSVLRWPLTHPRGITEPDSAGAWFNFVRDPEDDSEALESDSFAP
ncbi:MAG: rhomboid family intramembrane serine protease [Planctomycetes bacterium]|nr:rhomboid family intramembrane serine protease [Planctomycetota bacterium]